MYLISARRISIVALLVFAALPTFAKNPIKTAFFNTYPSVATTRLKTLPSNTDHCGMCHFDFNGGGPRNAYGRAVEARRAAGMTSEEAFLDIEGLDMDGDGESNIVEILDALAAFDNTPTFPGLNAANADSTSNVNLAEITPYLTPTTTGDTTPPTVSVLTPNGGENFPPNTTTAITWSASDANGISSVEIYFSDDAGANWKHLAVGLSNTGTYDWFVPNRPGSSTLIRVEAYDTFGNDAYDESNGTFTIDMLMTGIVPSTLRDMDLPGTQPFAVPPLADVETTCVDCHGNYDINAEPWFNWRGGMMAQAARDPLFFACLAVAEQDVPSVGDLCLRCHTPGGWLEGRSVDTSGGSLTAKDRQGVSCDFCHRLVDPVYVPGTSPAEDEAILNQLAELPQQNGNGQFVVSDTAGKRGPYSDALDLGHPVIDSAFHRSSNLCGTCHNVSNPAFDKLGPGEYVPNGFDAPHPTLSETDMNPVERTFDEWKASDFASGGVDLPQYGGVVSTCQDCHMRPVTAAGSNDPASPIRTDMPLHDLTGGNNFIQDLIADAFPGEVDLAELAASKARAVETLGRAARIELTGDGYGVTSRVYNDTGHKLPTGYPEGRRMWLQVEAVDEFDQVVYISGDYDAATGVLTHDEDLKLYHIKPGLSPGLAGALGLAAGPSFHFVLNDSTYSDTRIPPRGFTNAAFEDFGMPPVAYSYADGQYWDDTFYELPNTAKQVTVRLYYQAVSKEYVEFLQAENTTNSAGDDLYAGWVAHGRGAPVLMAEETISVNILTDTGPAEPVISDRLGPMSPNPFQSRASFQFALSAPGQVHLEVFDLRGRRVRVLEDEIKPAGSYTMFWDGRDDRGADLASGSYLIRYRTGSFTQTQRVVLMR